MTTLTLRVYPSAPIEIIDLEQRLEKELNDVNSFNNSNNNIEGMTTNFKYKNRKSKMKHKNYKIFTSILESVDRVVFISATTKFVSYRLPVFLVDIGTKNF